MNIQYIENNSFKEYEIKTLYDDVKWTAYTKDMPRLLSAIKNSLAVITAWDNENLVGLIRVVGDGLTIIYIQDILVLQNYQNEGIGSELMKRILYKYQDVRQKVLLTNDAANVRAFYEKNGFNSCDNGDLVSFAKID
ncbi:GNAT family N-acetyltransferase [Oceanobacillus sp. FSL K6-2867]|uniref:GNAT family N-acetyltransferase n=1 Tax=Oceanobacillus sp. FSL K6-2867 TaxID=2954748 RepID=UPI0030DA95A5